MEFAFITSVIMQHFSMEDKPTGIILEFCLIVVVSAENGIHMIVPDLVRIQERVTHGLSRLFHER